MYLQVQEVVKDLAVASFVFLLGQDTVANPSAWE
jgi:hypothetical protein